MNNTISSAFCLQDIIHRTISGGKELLACQVLKLNVLKRHLFDHATCSAPLVYGDKQSSNVQNGGQFVSEGAHTAP